MSNITTNERTESTKPTPADTASASAGFRFEITETTMKRILAQAKPSDLLALYAFLACTATRQHTQSVYANERYIGLCLKWSRSKVQRVKRELRGLRLVESVTKRDERGRIKKNYVRVHFLTKKQTPLGDEPEHQNTAFRSNESQSALEGNISASLSLREKKKKTRTGDSAPQATQNTPPISSDNSSSSEISSRETSKPSGTRKNSMPPDVTAVVKHALIGSGHKTGSVLRWLQTRDFDWQPASNLIAELYGEGKCDQAAEALEWAFRFIHYNNQRGWQLDHSWQAAFNGFRDNGINTGPSEVPANWVPHIADESNVQDDVEA